MKYGGGLSSSNIKVSTRVSRHPKFHLSSAPMRKGPRMPSLITPIGKVSTRVKKI
jgi:hypothetical protein